MDKDEKIKRLQAELAKRDAKLAKKELNEKLENSYVLEHFDLFDGLLEKLEAFKDPSGLSRYIGHRTGRPGSKNHGKPQPMIRLNLLVEDLIEFRARKNLLSEDGEQCDLKTLKVRFSQDVGSLLSHLDKARAKRTRKRSLDKEEEKPAISKPARKKRAKKAKAEDQTEKIAFKVTNFNSDGTEQVLDQDTYTKPEPEGQPPLKLPDVTTASINEPVPPETPAVSNFEIIDEDSSPAKEKRSRPSFGED